MQLCGPTFWRKSTNSTFVKWLLGKVVFEWRERVPRSDVCDVWRREDGRREEQRERDGKGKRERWESATYTKETTGEMEEKLERHDRNNVST